MRGFLAPLLAGALALFSAANPIAASARDSESSEPGRPVLPGFDSRSTWVLLVPDDGQVVYRGVVNFDNAGVAGPSILYPGSSAGGFLAAVLTHGLIVDATRNRQNARLQEAADQLLVAYRPVLADFSFGELMGRAQAQTAWAANGVAGTLEQGGREWLVESLPVFSLTQDQRAIVLDNVIALRRTGTGAADAIRLQVRVVSPPRSESEPVLFWTASGGERIKEESARLVSQSLDLAFAEAGRVGGDIPQRTLRYLEGGEEKIERAQLLSERCGRLVLRNLRGVLMSVPAARPLNSPMEKEDCPSTPGKML